MKKLLSKFWIIPFLLFHLVLYQNCGQNAATDTTELSAPQSVINEQIHEESTFITQASVSCDDQDFDLYANSEECLSLSEMKQLALKRCRNEADLNLQFQDGNFCGEFVKKHKDTRQVERITHAMSANDFQVSSVVFECLDGVVHTEPLDGCQDLEFASGQVFDTCIEACSGAECGVQEIKSFVQCKM